VKVFVPASFGAVPPLAESLRKLMAARTKTRLFPLADHKQTPGHLSIFQS
jgi:hypothetical protein